MKIHFGCAHARASRRMRWLAARDLPLHRAHPAPPHRGWSTRSAWAHPKWSEGRASWTRPRTESSRMRARRPPLSCETARRPVPVRSRAKLSKNDPLAWSGAIHRSPARAAARAMGWSQKTKRPGSLSVRAS